MRAKYHNTKTEVDGIVFDSRMEARRYVQLRDMQDAGIIFDLELQPEYEICPSYKKNGRVIRKLAYRADFRYVQDGKIVVEDVKGVETREFKIKKKLVEYKYPEVTITLVKR